MTGGDNYGSNMDMSTLYEKAVGECPVVTVRLGGVDVPCLLDSGSEVSTITEEFFNEHFRPQGKTLLPTGDWLRLTAANGLEIPYVGYLELDVEALGVMIPRRGILVVKSPASHEARQRKKIIPGLIGMNIIAQLHEPFKNGKAETSPQWSKVLKITSSTQSISVRGFAKVAGQSQIRVPAGSVSVLRINGWQGPQTKNTTALVEPLSGQVPGNLVVINTLTQVDNGQLHVRVANITDEDVWLQPHTRIGVLHEIKDVEDTKNSIDFKRVSVNEEMVFVRESTTEEKQEQPCAQLICQTWNAPLNKKRSLKPYLRSMQVSSQRTKTILDTQRQSNTRFRPQIKYQLHSLTAEFHLTSFKRQRITYESFWIMVLFKKATVLMPHLLC